MAWIKPDLVIVVYANIKELQIFEDYALYFDYFNKVWMDGMYKIKVWNVSGKLGGNPNLKQFVKHANNVIESFHMLLNYVLRQSHQPNIPEFIDAIKYIECRTKGDLFRYQNKDIIDVIFFCLSVKEYIRKQNLSGNI